MNTCRGLTVIPHEDLAKAVTNWTKAKKVWESYEEELSKQRDTLWAELPTYKRFWYQIRSGMFSPEEYWTCTQEWVKVNFPEELKSRLYQYVDHNGGWWSTKRYTARECCKHNTQSGTHYLTPEQVVFVSKFKDLY